MLYGYQKAAVYLSYIARIKSLKIERLEFRNIFTKSFTILLMLTPKHFLIFQNNNQRSLLKIRATNLKHHSRSVMTFLIQLVIIVILSTSVAPSGLLPSLLDNPIGSLLAGICAFLIARQIRSLSWEWRMWRGTLLRNARLCRFLASTIVPQTHMCGWHIIVPRWKPVAIRMASSDNRRPTAVRGGACSQSPACGVVKAFNRAWSTGSAHLARISL